MKFMGKHYVFIIIVALLTLILGLSFSLIPESDNVDARATMSVGTYYRIGFSKPWATENNTAIYGGDGTYTNYTNKQGKNLQIYGNIGSVKIASIDKTNLNNTYIIYRINGATQNNLNINTAVAQSSENFSDTYYYGISLGGSIWSALTYSYTIKFKSETSYDYTYTFEPVESEKIFEGSGTIENGKAGSETNNYLALFQPKKVSMHIYVDYSQLLPETDQSYENLKDISPYHSVISDYYCYNDFDFLDSSDINTLEENILGKLGSDSAGYTLKWYLVMSESINNRFKIDYESLVTSEDYLDEYLAECLGYDEQVLPISWNGDGSVKDKVTLGWNEYILMPKLEPNTYKVTLNANGGSFTNPSFNNIITVTYGQFYEGMINIPYKSGGTFQGFFTGKLNGTQYFNSNGECVRAWDLAKDTTLYAVWVAPKYFLFFNANGGYFDTPTTTTKKLSATYGSVYPSCSFIPVPPEGKYFNGYWTESGTQIYDASLNVLNNARYNTAESTTLYAQWNNETYNISYYSDDEFYGSDEGVEYGTPNYKLKDAPTKAGYTFKGWKLNESTTYSESIEKVPDFGNNGETIRLDAVWEVETYIFEFDSNGGSAISDQNYTYDTTPTLPEPTRTGYTFTGWEINNTGSPVKGSYKITDFGNNGTIVSCVAQWTPIGYTVRFNGNGGATTAGATTVDQAFTYDTTKKLTSNTFVKSGYIFTGWAESEGGSVAYYNMQEVINLASEEDAIKNLYAVWGETWLNDVEAPSLKDTKTPTNSASNPYLITSGKNLAWMALQTQTGSLSGYYQQEGDIDLAGKEWIPIGKNQECAFIGSFNGNGYEIKNIKISAITNVTRENNGLFGYCRTDAVSLKNIVISGTINVNGNCTGGIVGVIEASGTVENWIHAENCVNFAIINSSSNSVGGIVGKISDATIKGCANYANVTGLNNIGGMVGEVAGSSSSITQCYVGQTVTIKGDSSVGGIAGLQYIGTDTSSPRKLTLTFSAFEGTIDATSNYGAFIGKVESTSSSISDCYAKAVIPSSANYYGLVGNCGANIINNCVFQTKLASETSYIKHYKGTSFENWVMTSSGIPAPSGLTWIGTGGTKITDIQELKDKGYTSV